MNNGIPLPENLQRLNRSPLVLEKKRKLAARVVKESNVTEEKKQSNAFRLVIIKENLKKTRQTKLDIAQKIQFDIFNEHKILLKCENEAEQKVTTAQSSIDDNKKIQNRDQEIAAQIHQLETEFAKLPTGTHIQRREDEIREMKEEMQVKECENEQFSEFLAYHDDIETLQRKIADKGQSIRQLQVESDEVQEPLDEPKQKPTRKKLTKDPDWKKYNELSQVSSTRDPDGTRFYGQISDSSDSS